MNIQWLNDESIKDIAGGGVVAYQPGTILVSVDNAPRYLTVRGEDAYKAIQTDIAPPDGITVSRL